MRHWAGLIALAIGTAHAADPAPAASSQDQWPGYEVTPFVGLGLGGGFDVESSGSSGSAGTQHLSLGDRATFAIALDLRANDSSQYELFYARESSTLHGDATFSPTPVVIEYFHLGGLLLLNDETPVKPYLAGGLGLTRLSPDSPGSADTRFSASLGLGLRWPVNQHFAVRLEARGFATLVNSDTAIFCRSDQNGLLCRIHGHGQSFLQGMMLAGAALTF